MLAVLSSTLLLLRGSFETVATPQTINHFAPVKSHMIVTQINGAPQYAYEGTGWKLLASGKILKPGATVRAGRGSSVVLRAAESPTFIKVSSGTRLHLTAETPAEELSRAAILAEK